MGNAESTYEPAMTKAFLHGRTEAIRTVQPERVDFAKVSARLTTLYFLTDFYSSIQILECLPHDKIRKLHKACERHEGVQPGLGAKTGQFSCWLYLHFSIDGVWQTPVCIILLASTPGDRKH
jgi:carnitine O-acetyltransferase